MKCEVSVQWNKSLLHFADNKEKLNYLHFSKKLGDYLHCLCESEVIILMHNTSACTMCMCFHTFCNHKRNRRRKEKSTSQPRDTWKLNPHLCCCIRAPVSFVILYAVTHTKVNNYPNLNECTLYKSIHPGNLEVFHIYSPSP